MPTAAAGSIARAYAVFKAGEFWLAAQRKEYVPYNNQPTTSTLSEIDDWMFGRRNDSTAEPLNTPWRKLIIYPRALESYEMVDPDMTPVEPIPFENYAAITTDGGNAAAGTTTYDGTNKNAIGTTLQTGAGPRKIIVGEGVSTVETPYFSRDISSGGLTFQGNKTWWWPQGGGIMAH